MTAIGERSGFALGLARRYARWRCSRDLDGVWVSGLDALRAHLAREPLLLAPNHVAWWDVLVLVLLDRALGAEMRCLMDSRNLAALPFLGSIGAVPLRRGEGPAASEDLQRAGAWLDRPGRVLVIFPQGRQRPAHLRPLAFRRGVERLAAQTGARTVPVGWSYGFREDHRPAAALAIGAPGAGELPRLEAETVQLLARLDPFFLGEAPAAHGLVPLVPPPGGRTDDGMGSRLLRWMMGARGRRPTALQGGGPGRPT